MPRKLPKLEVVFIDPPMETEEDKRRVEENTERLFFKLFDSFLEWDNLKGIDDKKYEFCQEFKAILGRLPKK